MYTCIYICVCIYIYIYINKCIYINLYTVSLEKEITFLRNQLNECTTENNEYLKKIALKTENNNENEKIIQILNHEKVLMRQEISGLEDRLEFVYIYLCINSIICMDKYLYISVYINICIHVYVYVNIHVLYTPLKTFSYVIYKIFEIY
jgi:hypothetical protein